MPKQVSAPKESTTWVFMFFSFTYLVSDLKLYPYRIYIKSQLTQADMDERVTLSLWFSQKIVVVVARLPHTQEVPGSFPGGVVTLGCTGMDPGIFGGGGGGGGL